MTNANLNPPFQLITWVFQPTDAEKAQSWTAPQGYVRAQVGETRLQKPDVDMKDGSFEPGWKKVDGNFQYVD